jgi:hypothetical protein
MPTIVEILSDRKKYSEVFVSLERTPVLLADVRGNLPQLKAELCKKWQVENLRIENRIPRLRNPYHPSQIVEAACIGLLISFTLPGVKAVSKKVGEAVGDEIAKRVRLWIRSIDRPHRERRKGSAQAQKNRSSR